MANKSLYVGNLPYSVSEADLREIFDPYTPSEVRVIEGKGFGFVDLPEEMMQTAIDGINGKEIGGRTFTVNEARPRTERRCGSRGGYGGGGGRSGYGGGNKRW